MYDGVSFRKVVKAPESQAYIIRVDRFTDSENAILVTVDSGEKHLITSKRVKAFDKTEIVVQAGNQATIEYPIKLSSRLWLCGRLNLLDSFLDLDHSRAMQLQEACQISSVAGIHGHLDQALFVEEDETVWGIGGHGTQGTGSSAWLRKIDKPATCTDILKVYLGPHIRLILTKSGQVFLNGSAEEIAGFLDE